MKKILIATFCAAFSLSLSNIQAQSLPQPSPAATVTQTVGLTMVQIDYSRPGVKGRKIFGGLVPYNELWRTGANKATAITFSTDVKVAGQNLKAGSYAIFTKPGESEWEFIFNSNTEQWGSEGHKDDEDVLKVKVKPMEAAFTENMLFYFDNIRDNSGNLNLVWDKTMISLPLEVDVDEQAMINIKNALDEANGMFRVYNNAARYYLDHDKDKVKALEWATKSCSMDKKYWNLTVLANAQAANGQTKDAIKTANEALTMAKEAKNAHYTELNEKNIAEWSKKK